MSKIRINQSLILAAAVICLLILLCGGSIFYVGYNTVVNLVRASQSLSDDFALQTELVRDLAQLHTNLLWVISESSRERRDIRRELVDGYINVFDSKLQKCGRPCADVSEKFNSYRSNWKAIAAGLAKTDDLNRFRIQIEKNINPIAENLFDGLDSVAEAASTRAKSNFADTAYNSYLKMTLSGGALVLIVFLSGLFIYFIKVNILRPLDNMRSALIQVKDGFNVLFETRDVRVSEIREISNTFNDMVKSLSEKETIINRQNEALIQSSKMASLGKMSAGVAHEINNPLMIISGNLERIEARLRGLPEVAQATSHYLTRSRLGVERISKIVSGLKSYARDSTDDEKENVQLQVIFDAVRELTREKSEKEQIRLEIGDVPKASLLCRAAEVERVFINLLNNAMDAVAELPAENQWVRVGFQLQFNSVTVSVTDGGSGIPDDIASKMLDPFFTTKEVGKGTGLGLSISVGIVNELAGKLYLDKANPNTCFLVELPILSANHESAAA